MTKEEVLAKLKFELELRGLSKHPQAEYYTKVKLYQLLLPQEQIVIETKLILIA